MAIYDYTGQEIETGGGGSSDSLTERDYYCAFSLFETIGVVGDSYANGYNAETDGGSAYNHPALSWPQILARRNGVTVTNYATGGLSTRSFITNTVVGLPKLESDPAKCLYLLVLERNDYNYENDGHAGYLGAITDISGYSLGSYPDTFYGNYATIIERILAHAPNAKLVMIAGDYSTSNTLATQYNEAVAAIAEYYQIPCIKQRDEWYFASGSNSYYRTKVGGHPTSVAYCGMELCIERLFNKCVKDNFGYFKYYFGTTKTT